VLPADALVRTPVDWSTEPMPAIGTGNPRPVTIPEPGGEDPVAGLAVAEAVPYRTSTGVVGVVALLWTAGALPAAISPNTRRRAG